MCDSFYSILLSHFSVFCFMSCLDISEWKAFLIKSTIQYNFNDRREDEKIINCKHNAKYLNCYFPLKIPKGF